MNFFLLSMDALLYSSLLVAIVGLIYWRWLPKFLQVFTVLKIVSFLCDIGGRTLTSIGISVNHATIFWQLVQLVLLLWFYYLVFKKPRVKKPFLIIGISLTLAGIANWIINGAQSQALFLNAFNVAILLGLCVYYFYHVLKTESEVNILSAPLFWINTGLLIYLSGSLLLFLSADYIIRVLQDDFALFLTVHNFLGVIANGLFFYGIWLAAKQGRLNTAKQ